jgi:flagellar FliJ protein
MFQFKLQPVLSLKENLEDMKKRELGNAQQLKNQRLLEEDRLIEHQNTVLNTIKNKGIGCIDVNEMKSYAPYMKEVQKKVVAKHEEVLQAEEEVEERRKELQEAWKEKKILGNLKDIQKEIYRWEEQKKEQQVIDEIVSYKYLAHQEEEENG